MKKVTNYVVIEGKIFGMGRKPLKRLDDGRITGELAILTSEPSDPEQNIVEVNFIPMSKEYKSGKPNPNFKILENILESGKTVEAVGYSDADAVNITGNFDGNAYYTDDDKLVEFSNVRGGFINMRHGSVRPHTGFKVDALVMSIEDKETKAGEFIGKEIKAQVYDDYRKYFFPVSFVVKDDNAIDYIAANYIPGETYTQLDGVIVNKVIEKEEQESQGFGVSTVSSTFTIRENVITGGGVSKEIPMLPEEREVARQNRESYLAEQKAYALSRKSGSKKTKTADVSVAKDTSDSSKALYDF